MRNSTECIEKTTNYKSLRDRDVHGVDAVLKESDHGLKIVQKYDTIISQTNNYIKTDRTSIVRKNEMNSKMAVSPASGFTVPEQFQP